MQGMRHLLFPTLATSDCRSRLQEASHLGSGVQILGPEFRQCVYVCKRVSSVQFDAHVSACCSICTVGSGYDASCLAPPYEKFPHSRVSNICTGLPDTCLVYCYLTTALFGHKW